MKLQGLSIVFGLIVIPIILVVSYYISLQVDTITLQTSYDTKLLDATSDAMAAFELNTANEELSSVADSLRTIIEASSNVFINTLATNMGLSNASKSYIEPYVPAMLYTLYDGYYIYTPTKVPEILSDSSGNAVTVESVKDEEDNEKLPKGLKSEGGNVFSYDKNSNVYNNISSSISTDSWGELLYKRNDGKYTTNINDSNIEYKTDYVLKTYMPYSARYVKSGSYLEKGNIDIVINYSLDNYLNIYGQIRDSFYTKTGYLVKKGCIKSIEYREFGNNVPGFDILNYNEDDAEKFIRDLQIGGGKELQIKLDTPNGEVLLSNMYGEDAKEAIIYYVKAQIFSNWVYANLGELQESDIVEDISKKMSDNYSSDKQIEQVIYSFEGKTSKIFDQSKDPEDDSSTFNSHKSQVIRNSIQYNLNLAMSTYNDQTANSYNFNMPIIKNEEWHKIITNVSLVTFMQGLNCGLKKYNNYAVVSSTNNELTVLPDEIYYVGYNENETDHSISSGLDDGVSIYHRIDCPYLSSKKVGAIYRYDSFVSKEVKYDKIYDKNDSIKPYKYDHKNLSCYTCIVDGNYQGNGISSLTGTSDEEKSKIQAYYIALGKERNKLYKMNAIKMSEGYQTIYDKINSLNTHSNKPIKEIKSIDITLGKVISDESIKRYRIGYRNLITNLDSDNDNAYTIATNKENEQTITINVDPIKTYNYGDVPSPVPVYGIDIGDLKIYDEFGNPVSTVEENEFKKRYKINKSNV